MKKRALTLGFLLLVPITSIFAHDLFLKLDSFFAAVNEKVTIKILNGSFMDSQGAVRYDRLVDVSIVAPSGVRLKPTEADFT